MATASTVLFTDTELAVLRLFDQVQQLQLELALLRSQESPLAAYKGSQGNEQDFERLRLQLLEAKATLALRDCIVENTISLQPSLNAVHHATHASPAERDLLPTIEQRDTAAIRAAQLCSDTLKAKRQLAELERENLTLCQQNVELAQEVLSLEERAQIPQQVAFRSSTVENEVTSLEREVSTGRRRWKVIKGATSAIVAGSGVDWVRDEHLKTLVLESLDE
ncbi:hypothetical protein VTJ04DRAFT_3055 [Mycothermus thermophilus]|uniref:uncharacterized protein n=1 Tax=Humicola insolens TaxID=85995 RepID=UPI0037437217